jgi:hypothetical protein
LAGGVKMGSKSDVAEGVTLPRNVIFPLTGKGVEPQPLLAMPLLVIKVSNYIVIIRCVVLFQMVLSCLCIT